MLDTWFDVVSTALIVGADFVAIFGAATLVLHRFRPTTGPGWALVGLWCGVCGIGIVAALALVYRLGHGTGNSGEDRMMQTLLVVFLGPMCMAAVIAAFVKPR